MSPSAPQSPPTAAAVAAAEPAAVDDGARAPSAAAADARSALTPSPPPAFAGPAPAEPAAGFVDGSVAPPPAVEAGAGAPAAFEPAKRARDAEPPPAPGAAQAVVVAGNDREMMATTPAAAAAEAGEPGPADRARSPPPPPAAGAVAVAADGGRVPRVAGGASEAPPEAARGSRRAASLRPTRAAPDGARQTPPPRRRASSSGDGGAPRAKKARAAPPPPPPPLDVAAAGAAARLGVVWGTVKGFLPWPAQVLPGAAAAEHPVLGPAAPASAAAYSPVMFFGTREVAWLPASRVAPWASRAPVSKAVARGGAARLAAAVNQVRALVAGGRPPAGWWSLAKAVTKVALPPALAPVPAAAAAATVAAAAPPPSRRRRRPAGSPSFAHLRRNVWTDGTVKPRRAGKDDVQTCDCVPPQGDGGRAGGSAGGGAGDADPARSIVRRAAASRPVGDASTASIACPPGACINALSRVRCDARSCPAGASCANPEFQLMPPAPIEPFDAGGKGWGVRATAGMAAGSFVTEYCGEVVTAAECRARLAAAAAAGDATVYYMSLGPHLALDARAKGSIGRLINSSCDPNCVAQLWTDAGTGEPRVGIFTVRDVVAGEELAYDYAFDPTSGGADPAAYACACGAATCRGSLAVDAATKDSFKDRGRRLRVRWEGDEGDVGGEGGAAAASLDNKGRFFEGVIVAYSARRRAHTVAYDDGSTEVVDLRQVAHEWLDGQESESAARAPPPPPRSRKPRLRSESASDYSDATPPPPRKRVRDKAREAEARKAKRAAVKVRERSGRGGRRRDHRRVQGRSRNLTCLREAQLGRL